jgi:hypothetical protein
MQKDFMAMAQGQQAPAAVPQQEQYNNINDLKKDLTPLDDNNLPKGEGKKGLKNRIMALFEQSGVIETLPDNMSRAEFLKAVDELADALEKQDFNKAQQNPLFALLEKMGEGIMGVAPTGGPVPQQGAPKDFASMMPPTPGGISNGR